MLVKIGPPTGLSPPQPRSPEPRLPAHPHTRRARSPVPI